MLSDDFHEICFCTAVWLSQCNKKAPLRATSQISSSSILLGLLFNIPLIMIKVKGGFVQPLHFELGKLLLWHYLYCIIIQEIKGSA